MHHWATIIVAAGSGQRFGGDTPKQYALLGGRPVLAHSLAAFEGHGPVVVVVAAGHEGYAELPEHVRIVTGGATRQDSVKAGLAALQDLEPHHVMIHDAARPLIDDASIDRLKAAVEGGAQSATLAVPVVDTLMRGGAVVDRTDLYAVQTPQGFAYALVSDAHARADKNFTDDASLVAAITGVQTTLVTGHANNFKITSGDDLMRAEKLLDNKTTRVGLGFDVHRFGPGNNVRLFGVDMPCDYALVGHSDADAGLHAIADAILGTIGAGDIGVHFPPSDPACKDMDSALIVKKALELLHAKGGVLQNIDIMLMAEFPRITPHRDAALARLCDILQLPSDCIGLKATTTEKLGYIGRGEGLAVQAIVSVKI